MGAGCSSPIRKFDKRSKRRCSEPYGTDSLLHAGNAINNNPGSNNNDQKGSDSSPHRTQNDESPSYCTQQDKKDEDTKISEQSLTPAPVSTGGTKQQGQANLGDGRNLLYSPAAFSPAPSTCHSPSPAATPDLMVNLRNHRQRLYTIDGNHRHMISIYPERGTLVVWDIYEEKAVRIMHNLDQPRDLRMIDQKRAVILCNRELKVYNLDSGELLTKLKGVMNQKMPFFEIYGEQYVVALARNRMYVNMLNLVTGELETTFKVGEDRFLNSLLVSANGGICVCGDETQKPFPLLVWDLNERRLLYDLRLERHEFLTKISAISDDGHYVASACRQLTSPNEQSNVSGLVKTDGQQQVGPTPNFIVVYDLNVGTMFKKWKPGFDSCSISISLSPNQTGKVLSGVANSNIFVWDLATGSKEHTLVGHTAPVDFLQVQNDRLFSMDSTCRDKTLRIWDIEKGTCLAVFTPDSLVNCCRLSVRGDALACGYSSDTKLSTLVFSRNESLNDIVKKDNRRKSSGPTYVFDEPAPNRKTSQRSN